MSKILDANITCPSCGHSFDAKVYRSIWGEYPENRHLVFSDEINTEACPRCRRHMKLPCALLYTNADRRFAVWYEPAHDPAVDEDVRAYADMGAAYGYLASAPRIRDWEAFKGKIRDFEKGRGRATQASSPDRRKSMFRRLADIIGRLKGTPSLDPDSRPRSSLSALDLVADAERRYSSDPKRLRQLAVLRGRIDDDIRLNGSQPPSEIVRPLLTLVDRGVLPTPGAMAGILGAPNAEERPDALDRLTLLDHEVAFLLKYTVDKYDGGEPIAFSAVMNSIARGLILAVTVEDERLDELLPTGNVVDPATGEPDTLTNECLSHIATQEFRNFVDRRIGQVDSPTFARLLDVYIVEFNMPEELDPSSKLFGTQLTVIVKRSFLFGLWCGVTFPAKAKAVLVDLEKNGAVSHSDYTESSMELPQALDKLGSILIGIGQDAIERANAGESGIETDPKLAMFVLGPAMLYLRSGPQKDRQILESACGVRGGVWTEPQLRKYRRAVVRAMRENPPNRTIERDLTERFPVVQGTEIDVSVPKDFREVVFRMMGGR